MNIAKPLIKGRFLKRYKRFFADVILDDETVVAHVANTGSLKGLLNEGTACLLKPSDNPERKLKFTLEALAAPDGSWVGINTSYPNQLSKEWFEEKKFTHWNKFDVIKPEFKLNEKTRLDLRLTCSKTNEHHFVEIKNVTLKVGSEAQFPDAVTERGQKHLMELIELKKQGHSCEILFVIQRTDCEGFSPATAIDPEYSDLLIKAHQEGVLVTCAVTRMNESAIELNKVFTWSPSS